MRRAATRAVLCWLAIAPLTAAADACAPPETLPETEVRRVVDGDTLLLASGDRVRLIGIDAPELGRDGAPDEPLARDARAHLATLIELAGGRVALRDGAEPRDRHGRRLALVYTARHGALGAHLITHGLALAAVVPPNLDALDCHRDAELIARDARRGLWSLTPVPVTDAARVDATGFAVVRGRAGAWRARRGDRVLELDGRFTVRVRDADFDRWFGDTGLDAYSGAWLEVRGWVHPWGGGGYAMTVAHPAAIARISQPFGPDI